MEITIKKKAICGKCKNEMEEDEQAGVIRLTCTECNRTFYIR